MISDADVRSLALTVDQSFIVQAPAGSGKTALLVYRILKLLATVDQPQKILAITFTRKATAEMKSRLLELLVCAESDASSDDEFEQYGISLAKKVLEQDRKYGWSLLDSPHQLQVLTIDSFSAKLAASMPWLSRLGDRPRTTDNAQAHYAAAVESVLSELLQPETEISNALQTVMYELDFDYNRARRLLTSMLATRDQWLRHLLHSDFDKLRGYLEFAWQQLVNEQLSSVAQLFGDSLLEELLEIGVLAADHVKRKPGKPSPLEGLEGYERSIRFLGARQWRALSKLLLTEAGDWRKQLNINIGMVAKSKSKEALSTILEGFREVNDANEDLRLSLQEISSLPDGVFSDADWNQLLCLEKVLKQSAAALQLRFRATGECDHSEVTQRANLALQELEDPTELGLRMDAQLQHILVDEFQDTSHGQLELLRRLTKGWSQYADGLQRTLFLVGDPMQSIYRFREADVGLFLRVAENAGAQVFDNIEIQAISLTENFRSSKSLVAWFNQVFASSFARRNDPVTGAIKYSHAESNKAGEEINVIAQLAGDADEEAEMVVENVRKSLALLPTKADQVAILVRSRSQLKRIIPLLDRYQIAYAGVDIHPLKDLQAVLDVLALCKAICREDDRVSWLALLRGPWCGLTLSQIQTLLPSQTQTVWEQLSMVDTEQSQFDLDSSDRLLRFISIMRRALAQRQQVELASLTRWAWQALGGKQTLYGAAIADIETVFVLLSDIQRGGDLPALVELDRAMDGLYAQPSQLSDGSLPQLVISTMHKAKGLQYHTVILPCLASPARADDKELMMWAEHQDATGASQLLLAPQRLLEEEEASHYAYLRLLSKKRALNESTRLMYVACTRAERKLVLIACAKIDAETNEIKPPIASSALSKIWQSTELLFSASLGESAAIESANRAATNLDLQELESGVEIVQTLYRLPAGFEPANQSDVDWQLSQKHKTKIPQAPLESESLEYDWASQVATAVGIVLHNWFQYGGESVLDTLVDQALIRRWRSELEQLSVAENRLDFAIERLRTAVANVQADESSHFLFHDYAIQQNEFSIAALEDGVVNTYRIDRTFVDSNNVRWVVDYKSTATRNENIDGFIDEQIQHRHKAQLENYGRLMSQIDTRSIRLAVYFPLLKRLRSWPYSGAISEQK